MGRRMLISISLDSLFPHERVVRVDELELVVSQSVQLQLEQLFWVQSKSFCHGEKSAVGQSLWCIWGYSCLAREQYFAIQTNPTRKGPDSRHLFPAGMKAVLPQANNEVVTCFFCISTHYGLKVWNNDSIKLLVWRDFCRLMKDKHEVLQIHCTCSIEVFVLEVQCLFCWGVSRDF